MSSCKDPVIPACALCLNDRVSILLKNEERQYFECGNCAIIFLHPQKRLDPAAEKARYATHQNSPDDLGYRQFLSRLMTPMLKKLTRSSLGLDYGSGPGPTLSVMFEEKGHRMNNYDPFFTTTPGALESSYDFITCTEAAEHFFYPRKEFDRMKSLIKAGGLLGVMTEERIQKDFEGWYYRNDPTHVTFFSLQTFEWLAKHYEWTLEHPQKNVFLFRN